MVVVGKGLLLKINASRRGLYVNARRGRAQ